MYVGHGTAHFLGSSFSVMYIYAILWLANLYSKYSTVHVTSRQ